MLLLAGFARSFLDRFHVILPYHPGFGESADDESIQSMQDYVLHYAALFEQLGLTRINLVGASFGGLRVDAYRVGGDLADLEARFAAAYGISNTGAVLMRPDGYVAWNCPAAAAEPATALRAALARSLCTR